jgi:hypothetical protein
VSNIDPNSYDPGDYNVAEVEQFLKSNPDQAARILSAEQAGKDRTGVKDAAQAAIDAGNTPPVTDTPTPGTEPANDVSPAGNDVRTAGGDSVTPGTVSGTQDVQRSDDAAIADVRTGVVADNQPTPQVWDADKGKMVEASEMQADANTSGDGAASSSNTGS